MKSLIVYLTLIIVMVLWLNHCWMQEDRPMIYQGYDEIIEKLERD